MKIRSLLLDNLPLKIIAFILSLVLFIVVRGDKGTTTSVEVPLLIRVPDGYMQVGDPIDEVRVQLRGRKSVLDAVKIDELGPISISPSPSEGRAKHTFSPSMLNLPDGITAERFDPPSTFVELEAIEKRSVQVNVERALSGKPPPGFQLGKVSIKPSEVEIVGPRSAVEGANHVYVENIDLTGQTQPFTVERFVIPDKRSVKVNGSSMVQVEVEIVRKRDERVILGVPILVLNLTRPFQLIPSTVDLVLVGDEAALSQVDPSKIVVTIDASEEQDQPARTQSIKLGADKVFNIPDGVAVDGAEPPVVFLQTLPLPKPEPLPQILPQPASEDGSPAGEDAAQPTESSKEAANE